MTPEQRRNIVIAAIVIILLLLLIVLFFLLRKPKAPETPVDPGSVPAAEVRDDTATTPALPPVTPAPANAQTVARNFAERFGTYSTDVAFTNIEEVRELATPEYHAVLQSQVYELPEGTEYQGRTTRAISTEQTGGTEASGAMTFTVTVQHELTTADRANPTLQYQTAVVSVEQRGTAWLVSNFAWQ